MNQMQPADRGHGEVGRASARSQRAKRRTEVRPTPNRRRLALFIALTALGNVPLPAQPPLAPGEVQVERTFLPEAHASSFAFGLPGGVNFCYDPVRGGVNYAWTGGFLDLTNVRPVNKLIKAATLLGPVVYREAGPAPLRRGDAAHAPAIEFKGYTLRDSAVELRYTLDGVLVREEIRAKPDQSGLVRKFTVKKSAGEKWWYVLDGLPPSLLTAESTGEFSIVDQFKKPTP